MIICFILNTKQFILCGQCKENLYTDKLAGDEGVKMAAWFYRVWYKC